MDHIPAELQTAFVAVIVACVGYVARIVGKFAKAAESKVDTWLDSKLSASQREIAHRIGQEAVAFAATTYKEMGGDEKLLKARDYVIEHAGSLGISLTDQELKGIIEKAYAEFQSAAK